MTSRSVVTVLWRVTLVGCHSCGVSHCYKKKHFWQDPQNKHWLFSRFCIKQDDITKIFYSCSFWLHSGRLLASERLTKEKLMYYIILKISATQQRKVYFGNVTQVKEYQVYYPECPLWTYVTHLWNHCLATKHDIVSMIFYVFQHSYVHYCEATTQWRCCESQKILHCSTRQCLAEIPTR